MKKILFAIVLVFAVCFSAVAQDGFFRSDADGYVDRGGGESGMSGVTPNLVGGPVGGSNSDAPAPVGSGLLIMTALGGAYLLRRREK